VRCGSRLSENGGNYPACRTETEISDDESALMISGIKAAVALLAAATTYAAGPHSASTDRSVGGPQTWPSLPQSRIATGSKQAPDRELRGYVAGLFDRGKAFKRKTDNPRTTLRPGMKEMTDQKLILAQAGKR